MSLEMLAKTVGKALKRKGWVLATAESCTGGWAAQVITAIAGSSAWFDRGFVTYHNQAKIEMLDVHEATLDQHGAVSEQTAIEMAEGALVHSRADITLAITGIAGPTGATQTKPLGTVWLAWAVKGHPTHTACCHFKGSRTDVRHQAVKVALEGVITASVID